MPSRGASARRAAVRRRSMSWIAAAFELAELDDAALELFRPQHGDTVDLDRLREQRPVAVDDAEDRVHRHQVRTERAADFHDCFTSASARRVRSRSPTNSRDFGRRADPVSRRSTRRSTLRWRRRRRPTARPAGGRASSAAPPEPDLVPGDDVVLGQAVEHHGDSASPCASRIRGRAACRRRARRQVAAETQFGPVRPPAGAVHTHA